MKGNNGPKEVQDGVIITLDYTVTVDGEIVDTSQNAEPILFIQGKGHIVPGLERALYGMSQGESKEMVVAAADGYGEVDEEAFAEIPRSEFPPEIPLEPGVELQLRNQEGDELEAFIVSADNETVHMNFNHPLAGKELHFSVKVIELRQATEEELDHEHVHIQEHDH
ncbi:MAG: peptidylprolyl isomerase [Anaerolineales bacterium]|nr:peptidylprolyl isomerase [Anaerolineales bacterium]